MSDTNKWSEMTQGNAQGGRNLLARKLGKPLIGPSKTSLT